jgi:hypothetical protein
VTAAIRLVKGAGHDCADGAGCLFEWFNWLTINRSTDARPADVSPVLHQYGMQLNDALPDGKRQQLARFLPNGVSPLAGTYRDGKDEARGYMALDWLIRTYAPAWLDLAGLTAEASPLRDLDCVSGPESARAASPVVNAAAAAAAAAAEARAAAWDAAWAAAWDAAGDAAGTAAWTAAGTAAGAAAWTAARDAARDAAGDAAGAAAWTAARDAAWDALAPTVAQLQDSAISLYDLMITGEWPS